MHKLKLLHKIILVQVLLIFFLFSLIFFVNLPKIDNTIYDLEEKNAKDSLVMIANITQNFSDNLNSFKISTLNGHKDDLKNVINTTMVLLEHYNKKYQNGEITLKKAKYEAYKSISKIKYSKTGYMFIVNDKYHLVSHPNSKIVGKDFTNIADINGKYFVKEMVDNSKLNKEAYVSYWWEKTPGNISKKLSYVKRFEPWGIAIGTGVYIDDIQRDIEKQTKKLIDQLNMLMNKIKIGKTGYIYIFSENGDMIVHPDKDILGTKFKTIRNKESGNLYYKDFINSARTTGKFKYKWNKLDDKNNFKYDKISWVREIPDLKWYVASSVYIEELRETSGDLKKTITKFAIIALIISVLISILLLRKILLPLQQLSIVTNLIAKGDYKARVKIYTADEIGTLSKDFNTMIKAIENGKQELQNLNNNLEIQVAEKTKNLSVVNRELEESEYEVQLMNENLLKQVQEGIEINRLKDKQMLHQNRLAQMGEMISMIAHQWRQPLNAISLTASNMQFKLMMDNIDKKVFQEEIALIDEYSQHLSKTIDDFRGFFKEDKEKTKATLENIANNTLEIVRISIENHNIKINTQYKCHKELNTYPNEIKQVILNLIKNAEDILLDSNTENPVITIQTICNENNQELIVKDNGGGIPKEIMPKIFDPYFSTKLEKDGTGLGLYMSKVIIEDHCKGTISAKNDKYGAVFSIKLYA